MAEHQLGKLCLSLHFDSLCRIHPSHTLRSKLNRYGYEDWLRDLRRGDINLYRLKDPDYTHHFELRQIIKDHSRKWAEKKSEDYRLYKDVLPFLSSVTKPEWPFSDTVIYVHTSRWWQQECLRELGIPLNDESAGSSKVKIRSHELLKWAKNPKPFTIGESIRANYLDLKKRRSDHQDFRHISVSSELRNVFSSLYHGVPSVLTVRNKYRRPPVEDSIDLTDLRVPKAVKGAHRIKNLPRIKSLFALRDWKEEYFGCVNPQHVENVVDVMAKDVERKVSNDDVVAKEDDEKASTENV